MNQPILSNEIRRFILANIPTVPHLEALLLLRSEPHAWTGDALARRLYVEPAHADALLAHLQSSGLVRSDAGLGHVYAPDPPEVAELIAQLCTIYSRHIVTITDLIHSIGDRKAQRFADAFRWRKER